MTVAPVFKRIIEKDNAHPPEIKNNIIKCFEEIFINCKNVDSYFVSNIQTEVLFLLLTYAEELGINSCLNCDVQQLIKNKKFYEYIYEANNVQNLIKDCIKAYVQCSEFFHYKKFFKTILPAFLFESGYIEKIVNYLEEEKFITKNDDYLTKYKMTLDEFVKNIKNESHKKAVILRLDGATLEEAGNVLNVSRERIRQLQSKVFKVRPPLEEDANAIYFETYNLEKENFKKLFQVSERTYNYLNFCYEKGIIPAKDILKNKSIPIDVKKRYEEELNKNFIIFDNEKINANKTDILNYFIQNFCKNTIKMEDFKKKYYEFLVKNQISDSQLIYSEEYIEAQIPNKKNLFWSTGKNIRFYDIEGLDIALFTKKLNLNRYKDIEISTKLIFITNKALMKEYDIQNEYELHNLLKKTIRSRYIKFSRMPIVKFGNVDRHKQILKLISEFGPIKAKNLALEYEKRYGVNEKTFIGSFLKEFEDYNTNGTYQYFKKS